MKKDVVKFCMLHDDAVMPSKRDEDAGWDIYPCFNSDWMRIRPHQTVMIPTGIASVFDSKYVMILKERGSTGTKGLGQRSGVIDSGYRGEWMIPITNHNNYDICIVKEDYKDTFNEKMDTDDCLVYSYDKAICQAVLLPVPDVDVEKISKEELEAAVSERGTGKLGSSGK